MIISFIGIDGSGKSSYSSKLYNELKLNGLNCKFIHFESVFAHIFMKILYGVSKKKVANKKDKLANNTRSNNSTKYKYGKYLWAFILIADDILFYLLNFNKRNLIICDRYFYDSAVTSINSGINNSKIYRIYNLLFPKPDLTFLMDIDPNIAYERRQEELLANLINKDKIYKDLYTQLKSNKMKINSAENFDKSFILIKNEVTKLIGEN